MVYAFCDMLIKLVIMLAGTALAAMPYRELYEQDLRRKQTKLLMPRQSVVPLVPFYAVLAGATDVQCPSMLPGSVAGLPRREPVLRSASDVSSTLRCRVAYGDN